MEGFPHSKVRCFWRETLHMEKDWQIWRGSGGCLALRWWLQVAFW